MFEPSCVCGQSCSGKSIVTAVIKANAQQQGCSVPVICLDDSFSEWMFDDCAESFRDHPECVLLGSHTHECMHSPLLPFGMPSPPHQTPPRDGYTIMVAPPCRCVLTPAHVTPPDRRSWKNWEAKHCIDWPTFRTVLRDEIAKHRGSVPCMTARTLHLVPLHTVPLHTIMPSWTLRTPHCFSFCAL